MYGKGLGFCSHALFYRKASYHLSYFATSATGDTHMQNNVITKVQAMTRINCYTKMYSEMMLKDYMLRAKYSSKC